MGMEPNARSRRSSWRVPATSAARDRRFCCWRGARSPALTASPSACSPRLESSAPFQSSPSSSELAEVEARGWTESAELSVLGVAQGLMEGLEQAWLVQLVQLM